MASGTLKKDVILNLEINDQEAVNNIAALTKKLDELKLKRQNLSETIKKAVADEQKANNVVYTKQQEQARYDELYYQELAKVDMQIKETKRSLGSYQKELQNNLVAEKTATGSLDAMRAQLANMRREYESLSEAERNNPLVGEKQQQDIADLTQKIKDLEYAQLDFRRNVGNYPEVGNAKEALREMKQECQNLAVALFQTQGKIQAQNAILAELEQTVGKNSQEYKDAAEELRKMNENYDTSNQKLNEMIENTGQLTDTLGDVNQRINSFANDQQKIVAMQEGVNVLTGAYTVLQGSLKALGIESKSLLEVYARIQIVQQSINSLMQIYKALNKDSNLMIVLRSKLEKTRLVWAQAYAKSLEEQNAALIKNTAAESANTVTTTAMAGAETVATGATFSLKAAFDALKASLMANPFTAILVGILAVGTAIAGVVKKIVKSNKEAKESEKELAEQAKKTSEEYKKSVDSRVNAMNSASKKYTEQIAKVKALLSVVKSESAAYAAKKKAMDELNRLVPAYNGHLSKTGQIVSENSKAIDKYIKDLERQAEATATMNALISAYEVKIDAERRKSEDNRRIKDWEAALERARQRKNIELNLQSQGITPNWEIISQAEKDMEWYEKHIAAAKEDLKEVNSELAAANREVEFFSRRAKDLNVNTSSSTSSSSSSDKESEQAKSAQATYDEMLKLANDYYKELDKMATDSVNTLTEKENLRYKGERDQLQQALVDAQKLYEQLSKDPKLLKELQKKNKFLSLETLGKQITILEGELENAEKKHNENLSKITDDTTVAFNEIMSKLRSDLDSASGNLTTKYTAQLQARLKALDDELKKELEAHEYNEQQKLEITKLYEEKKKQAIDEFSTKSGGKIGDYSNIENVNQLHAQLASDLAEIEAMKQAELAVFQGTEEEKLAITERYAKMRVSAEKAASKQEAKIWMGATMDIASALASSMGNMADMMNTLAENDDKMQKYSKQLAMGQIILSAAVATAQAVVAAINAGKNTGLGAVVTIPLFLAEFMGIVAGVIAQAKQTLSSATASKPRFAEGGLVGTRTTTKKDDKIDAKLTEGEYVIKSEIVQKLGVPFFDYINYGKKITHTPKTTYAEGGKVVAQQQIIPQNIIRQTEQQSFDMEEFRTAITDAISEMPNPVVSVKEISTAQKRVKMKETISTIK